MPEFFLDPEATYLSHGCFGAVPRRVMKAANELRERIEFNPEKFMRTEVRPRIRRSAERLAEYLNARGEDLVFVDNATTAVNAVLRSIVLMPGDEVVTTNHAYGAVDRVLEFVTERASARLIHARVPYPSINPDDVVEAIEDRLTPRTRLLVIDHISSPTALIFPVREIIEMARDRGIPVLIDGAHAPGQIDLDIASLDATWYVGNVHKWVGAPKGCGFLWTTPSRQPFVRPTTISHGIGEGYTASFDWPGTREFTSWLVTEDALDFRAGFGEDAIRNHCRSLALKAGSAMAQALGTQAGTTPGSTGFMATALLPWRGRKDKATIETIQKRLRSEYNLSVDINLFDGDLWLRSSFYIYNEEADIDALVAALKTLPTD